MAATVEAVFSEEEWVLMKEKV